LPTGWIWIWFVSFSDFCRSSLLFTGDSIIKQLFRCLSNAVCLLLLFAVHNLGSLINEIGDG
jgi:hypothetical protein